MKNYFEHKMRGKSPIVIAAMVFFGIIAIGGLAILFGFTVMWLWNWLMPELFGLPTLTFWKAVGLALLAKLLFGGFGGKSGSGSNHKSGSCDSKKKNKKNDFSKWAHYDKFWEEHGDKAYEEYCENINNPKKEEATNSETLKIDGEKADNDKTE